MIAVNQCCQAADLALKLGRAEEAAALCHYILSHYHQHLYAHLLLGQARLEQQHWTDATRRFRAVQQVDPECPEAYSGLGVIAMAQDRLDEVVYYLARAFENAPESDEVRESLQQALAQQAGRSVPPPAFTPACVGRFYLRRGLPQPAAEAYAAALRDDPDREDLRLAYATALWQAGLPDQALDLCRPLLSRPPQPLTALLIAAAEHFRHGEVKEGRRLWKAAHSWDPEDSRAREIFGTTPGLPIATQPAQVPLPDDPTLRDLLDMAGHVEAPTQPTTGQAADDLARYVSTHPATAKPMEPSDPDLRRFHRTVQQVHTQLFEPPAPTTKAPRTVSAHEGQQITEVILAWEEGLRSRFGTTGTGQIDKALQALSQAATKQGLASRLVYIDRPPYPELPHPTPSDPRQIKVFIDELDRRMGEEALDFHYLLLVGGDDLLPFARLPNPSEDSDETVPSDNVYASRDPTYLIPERAVGRIPHTGGDDPGPLLAQLAQMAARRQGHRPPRPPSPSGCLGLFMPWIDLFRPRQPIQHIPQRRFGLSAQVWAEASQEVLDVLPAPDPLQLCPPTCRDQIDLDQLAQVPFAYFNLHGAADSPNWYGQRDLTLPGEGPMMPIAFSPRQIPTGQAEGTVVYSEACYGAHILDKDGDSSIALRFVAQGALGFVGSTVISYGVSRPPLTDADLLGRLFWQHLLEGDTLGDALLQAKLDFTREMYRRQGYLDGDDMKTLLQFVLYGDPLASVGAFLPNGQAHVTAEAVPIPPVLSEQHKEAVALHHLSGDLVARVRRSLSWLQQEEVESVQVTLRSRGRSGRYQKTGKSAPTPDEEEAEALVFTSRREVWAEDGICIPQMARVVVNSRGRIVKMAVTR